MRNYYTGVTYRWGGASLFGLRRPHRQRFPILHGHGYSLNPEGVADLNDVAELTGFIDGIMKVHMDIFKIPGSVISVVKDGKSLFAKGYGHSNIKEGALVDPETNRPYGRYTLEIEGIYSYGQNPDRR